MTLTINGKRQEFIGCRTFVSIAQLIGLLAFTQQVALDVSVNGKHVDQMGYPSEQVTSGDKISISIINAQA